MECPLTKKSMGEQPTEHYVLILVLMECPLTEEIDYRLFEGYLVLILVLMECPLTLESCLYDSIATLS